VTPTLTPVSPLAKHPYRERGGRGDGNLCSNYYLTGKAGKRQGEKVQGGQLTALQPLGSERNRLTLTGPCQGILRTDGNDGLHRMTGRVVCKLTGVGGRRIARLAGFQV